MLISIMAVYNWDNSVFDGLTIPQKMDKNLLIKLILQKLAELSLVYSDPDWLKILISAWSQGRVKVWERMYDLSLQEYDPLENYNRVEETGGNENGGRQGNAENKNYSYGYNEETARKHHDDTDTEYNETYYKNNTISGRIRGNIGVTTSQQMAEQEMELRPKLDIYNWIVEEFKHEFCVMIY